MTMMYNSLLSPNFIPTSPIKPTKDLNYLHPHLLLSGPVQHTNTKRVLNFPIPAIASVPYQPNTTINVDYLESEFSGHGLTFTSIGGANDGESCVVRMQLDNGSSASLVLPSGLVTSYKAPMWHRGTLELLHTSVSEGESGALIQGGMSLALKCESNEDDIDGTGVSSWSPTRWALHQVRGSPQDAVQIELISSNPENKVEVKHIVTLQRDLLSSELVVSNSKYSSTLSLMGSVLSHLTVSTPEATYTVGLEGSNFYNTPPLLSSFTIVPPERSTRLGTKKLWSPMEITEFIWSGWGVRKQNKVDDAERKERVIEEEELEEGEESDNYKHLTEKMSRIYTSAPRYMTLIDRGRRNSVVVGRDGFNEVYMLSPGSGYEWYGKYAYICIGQSALLQPITIDPQGVWRGWQHIHNPNL